jgi:hypothetical protein
MIDGLRLLSEDVARLSSVWLIGDGWKGNAADLMDLVADELAELERQPLTGVHDFVDTQHTPSHCLLVITRVHQGPVLCNLPPDHPIHGGQGG